MWSVTENFCLSQRCYYVLGDNAGNSLDSRYWEEPFVREADIVAKMIYHYSGSKYHCSGTAVSFESYNLCDDLYCS